jgi:hypothetical protein
VTTHDRQGGKRITGLIYPTFPRVGLFGIHDGKRFAGLLASGEVFMCLHKNSLSLNFKLKGASRIACGMRWVEAERLRAGGLRGGGAFELALDPLWVAAAVEHGFYVGGACVDLVINREGEDVAQ